MELKKYKNRTRALVNSKIRFKTKRTIEIKKGVFMVPLFTSGVRCNRSTN